MFGDQLLGARRLYELQESKLPFASRIEFIRSKLSHLSPHISGVSDARTLGDVD